MKKTVIFGAGMAGEVICDYLGSDFFVVAFADNDPGKQGSVIHGIPVLSPEASLMTEPLYYVLGVLDEKRASEMEAQLRELGWTGQVIHPVKQDAFDIRTACMRKWAVRLSGEDGIHERVEGDCAELGVYRGEFAFHINAAFRDRKLHLFDTFEGFSESDLRTEKENGFSCAQTGEFSDTAQNQVWQMLPYREKAVMHKGYFPDTFTGFLEDGPFDRVRFAFVSLDADLYEPTVSGLRLFYPRLSPGGILMVHDYGSSRFRGVKKAVDEFCRKEEVEDLPVCDLHGSVILRKPAQNR